MNGFFCDSLIIGQLEQGNDFIVDIGGRSELDFVRAHAAEYIAVFQPFGFFHVVQVQSQVDPAFCCRLHNCKLTYDFLGAILTSDPKRKKAAIIA